MSATDDRSLAPRLTGGLALAVAAGHALPALAGAWPALRAPLGIEDRTASGNGYALTFDDGPHPQGTPAVLEILAAAGVQATFFLVGEQVEHDAALAREVAGAGHHVGVHCQACGVESAPQCLEHRLPRVSEPGLAVEVVDGDEAAPSLALGYEPVVAACADGRVLGSLDIEIPTVGQDAAQRAGLELLRQALHASKAEHESCKAVRMPG